MGNKPCCMNCLHMDIQIIDDFPVSYCPYIGMLNFDVFENIGCFGEDSIPYTSKIN